jgi:hypothetical protein
VSQSLCRGGACGGAGHVVLVGGGGGGYHGIFGIVVPNIEVGPLEQIEQCLVRQSQPHGLVKFGFQAKAFAL